MRLIKSQWRIQKVFNSSSFLSYTFMLYFWSPELHCLCGLVWKISSEFKCLCYYELPFFLTDILCFQVLAKPNESLRHSPRASSPRSTAAILLKSGFAWFCTLTLISFFYFFLWFCLFSIFKTKHCWCDTLIKLIEGLHQSKQWWSDQYGTSWVRLGL